MKPSRLITAVAFCLLVTLTIGLALQSQITAQTNQAATNGTNAQHTQKANYRLSGPYTHKNLSIFLVHGRDLAPNRTFLTLQEALAQKKVVVYETKDVNELAIQNFSNQEVYVQAGDIVKGGDQDRMISVDFIVPARSKRMPIAAFCVESGRWNRRGNESSSSFSASENVVTSKDLKLAAKSANSQQAVWENVKVVQDKLSQNVGTTVNSAVSVSSLELAVENDKVKESIDDYIKALSAITRNKPDVIGYVFAINGKVNSADIYASRALFAKLWSKLLKANATEAIAELHDGNPPTPVTDESIHGFLAEAEKGPATEKAVTTRVNLVTREDAKNIFFETRDRAQSGVWIHRNYIKKD
jgi:ARG and Rhodanese-Phosphatase-superfamily-associated Protein domain